MEKVAEDVLGPAEGDDEARSRLLQVRSKIGDALKRKLGSSRAALERAEGRGGAITVDARVKAEDREDSGGGGGTGVRNCLGQGRAVMKAEVLLAEEMDVQGTGFFGGDRGGQGTEGGGHDDDCGEQGYGQGGW